MNWIFHLFAGIIEKNILDLNHNYFSLTEEILCFDSYKDGIELLPMKREANEKDPASDCSACYCSIADLVAGKPLLSGPAYN
jgi:hypothetical protein